MRRHEEDDEEKRHDGRCPPVVALVTARSPERGESFDNQREEGEHDRGESGELEGIRLHRWQYRRQNEAVGPEQHKPENDRREESKAPTKEGAQLLRHGEGAPEDVNLGGFQFVMRPGATHEFQPEQHSDAASADGESGRFAEEEKEP